MGRCRFCAHWWYANAYGIGWCEEIGDDTNAAFGCTEFEGAGVPREEE